MHLYATTIVGLEDLAAKEVEKFGCEIKEIRRNKGRLFFEGARKSIVELNLASRMLERVMLLLLHDRARTLKEIYSKIRKLDFSFIPSNYSFAVRATRIGVHEFTSLEIANVAGKAVIDSYLSSKKKRLKVNLNNPDVIIRVDLIDDELIVGIDTTGEEALHKRPWRVYNHPAHLNSIIACGLITLSKWKKSKHLIDPMCGSGTIPIECARIARNIPANKERKDFAFQKLFGRIKLRIKENKKKFQIFGMEKFKKHLEGAKRNAEMAGVMDTITLAQGDATELKGSYDCIVVNPPYGLRIASKGVIEKLYEKFLFKAKECMHDKSRLVIITSEISLMKKAIEKAKLYVEHKRDVKYGGLDTRVFVVKI